MTASPTASHDPLDTARRQLRERQGPGARYDDPAAPHLEIDWARRGSAYFIRELDQIVDNDFSAPSLLDGWTRAELIAHVGYNARALTRLCTWANTGVETPMYSSSAQRSDEILRGGSLPARALRSLIAHSRADLDVAWRDLNGPAWSADVRTAQGRTVPASETAWMRCREVWVHAVDLDSGASFAEFPRPLLERILADVVSVWRRRGEEPDLVLAISDDDAIPLGTGRGPTVTGSLSDVTGWVTGRRTSGVHTGKTGRLPTLPRWL